jgi:CheY-like chemotaxis protein
MVAHGSAMPPYHILVADDDDDVRALIARILARTFPSVTIWSVKNGLEALDIYDYHPIDLLITNYDMPGLDGIALIATMRQARQATIPILMISASVRIERQARAVGVTDFLLKPFAIPQLTTILKALLPP